MKILRVFRYLPGTETLTVKTIYVNALKLQNPCRHEFMPQTRHDQWQLTKLEVLTTMCIRASAGKWPTVHMAFNGTVLDICNRAVSEKNPQIFRPPLPAKYVTVFSGRTDTAEVRCDLTDRQTHRQT